MVKAIRWWYAALFRVLGLLLFLAERKLGLSPATAISPSGRLLDKDLSASGQCETRKGMNYSRER